jgi:hypothetical protein
MRRITGCFKLADENSSFQRWRAVVAAGQPEFLNRFENRLIFPPPSVRAESSSYSAGHLRGEKRYRLTSLRSNFKRCLLLLRGSLPLTSELEVAVHQLNQRVIRSGFP